MHKASETSTLLSSNRNTNNKTDMKLIYVLNGGFEEHLHPGILRRKESLEVNEEDNSWLI